MPPRACGRARADGCSTQSLLDRRRVQPPAPCRPHAHTRLRALVVQEGRRRLKRSRFIDDIAEVDDDEEEEVEEVRGGLAGWRVSTSKARLSPGREGSCAGCSRWNWAAGRREGGARAGACAQTAALRGEVG